MWLVESAEGEGDKAWKMEESGEEILRLLLVPLHKRSGYGSSRATAANTYNPLRQIDPTTRGKRQRGECCVAIEVLILTDGLDTVLFPHGYLVRW